MRPIVVIGICSRSRHSKLSRLLKSIAKNVLRDDYDVRLVVVDNNDVQSIYDREISELLPMRATVIYEPRIGLVYARNRAVDYADKVGTTWFIGLDDDEWVSETWLGEFLSVFQKQPDYQLWMGPCQYIYDSNLSSFLSHEPIPELPHGSRPSVMTTQNFAMHSSVFSTDSGAGLRFDALFNESGGEDLEFFLRAEKLHDFKAGWLPAAVVYEDRKEERATLKYRLYRSMRNQISELRIRRIHRETGLEFTRLMNFRFFLWLLYRNIFYAFRNFLRGVLVYLFNPRYGKILFGMGMNRVARLVGMAYFCCGRTPRAYGERTRPN